jgi:hypothetical protein
MKVYVIDQSNYGRSVSEVPANDKESSHLRLNNSVMDNAATFLKKKSKLCPLIVDMLKSETFKNNFR